MNKIMDTMDGNGAAAHVAYAFTEVAGIYPITPSSPMAEKTDEWSAGGKKNIFGQTVQLVEMQSEAGAAGAMHGALEAGALATSYTSSQGLMLMIPTMHRISGQRHPGVLHVASRTVGTHAFSIFGDHSDVMNCRQTGFAMLSTGSVQEVMDLGGIAHLSAIKSRIPFLHFFDGFRTSHEIQKIECIDYKDFSRLLDWDALERFRKNALNPEHPVLRSSVQNPDIYFQVRESNNRFYDALPGIVENYMDEINKITGRDYQLFNYYGATDAEYMIIAMGSVSGAVQETVDYLNSHGAKTGFVQVHLYRPFSAKHLFGAIPETVKRIAVLDRLKEAGAIGEPLYEDICTAYANRKNAPELYAGRYGLSSKDTTPTQIKAVYDNLAELSPKNHFTIGIHDDVTGLSLETGPELFVESAGTVSCKFWGLGSDGTVGANKSSIKIIGENTEMYTQAYFEYDTKKSFGVTKSHLRFGKLPIRSSYLVKRADFVACHNQTYLSKYDIISELKEKGTFLLNCEWEPSELEDYLPAQIKKYMAEHDINFYIINANKISQGLGLGNRSNMVLQAAFFKLAEIIPVEDAIEHMKVAIRKTYEKKGDNIVQMNMNAIDRGIDKIIKVKVPAEWKNCVGESEKAEDVPAFIKNILVPINAQEGDNLPVSAFAGMEDGTLPFGTSAYEKRGIATELPVWKPENCLQCNQCSFVCPHAVIRPYLLDKQEAESAPEGFARCEAKGAGLKDYYYSLQISAKDCSSCGSCAAVCPAKEKALTMTPVLEIDPDLTHWEYGLKISQKVERFNAATVKGSQFKKPLLEFSGACAGCGETPYVKLLTQLFGDKMYQANATGCSQAWGSAMPCIPYTTTPEGRGPAWSNSLFENNAEFSLGMYLAVKQQREAVSGAAAELLGLQSTGKSELEAALTAWLGTYDDLEASQMTSKQLVSALESSCLEGKEKELADRILSHKDQLTKKTMWMVGGDGWAYDIGYCGLDHVFSMGVDINVLILDTEVYSNTGGQASKATPIGAVAQFAASGKKSRKKDLGMLMMTYKDVYVAQVAMGADQGQLVKALMEAERYPGPSIIIAYAPCITHGIKAGMHSVQQEMKDAVESGYWCLYRYNPMNENSPFTLDSKRPVKGYTEFLRGEVRYASLEKTFPENAKKLFEEAERAALEKFERYQKLAETIKK
jgi:pyruvate-ferredoxin/flavodoxin oxidoreductase